jgi:hypothetical protein
MLIANLHILQFAFEQWEEMYSTLNNIEVYQDVEDKTKITVLTEGTAKYLPSHKTFYQT